MPACGGPDHPTTPTPPHPADSLHGNYFPGGVQRYSSGASMSNGPRIDRSDLWTTRSGQKRPHRRPDWIPDTGHCVGI